jgi:hypothetical protein
LSLFRSKVSLYVYVLSKPRYLNRSLQAISSNLCYCSGPCRLLYQSTATRHRFLQVTISGSSCTRSPLLHRFLQVTTQCATSSQASAAPGFLSYRGSCRLPHSLQHLLRQQLHQVSAPTYSRFLQVTTMPATSSLVAAAPGLRSYTGYWQLQVPPPLHRFLAGYFTACNIFSGTSYTRSPQLHRFLQVPTQPATSSQAAAAPGFRCYRWFLQVPTQPATSS